MGRMYALKCTKCGYETELIYIQVEDQNDNKQETLYTTHYCKDCGRLSVIDTIYEEIECKHCKSKNLIKGRGEYKCPKCGNKEFEDINELET
ncbi:hypothetical protein GF343_03120 [Candidatus Woesearchaeota archaeon]|nr:hypothetical protein [Candidatus Woesearchaeota archaeon]